MLLQFSTSPIICERRANPDAPWQDSGVGCNNLGQYSGATLRNSVSAGTAKTVATAVPGQCLCGDVQIEIDFPARWAWHDHSASSRHAHGAAYATYVGSWRRRFRVTKGMRKITTFKDPAAGTVRRFCAQCGTPLFYERAHSPQMVNVSRSLFKSRKGRAVS